MLHNPVVSREEWLVARIALLRKEKEFTRLCDQLSAERRALPWVRVEKEYLFDGPAGKVSLADLFDGRSQLIIKHFMFGPDWEQGCVGCSFGTDNILGALAHLRHHDVAFAAVSRAPLDRIEAFKRRMGWHFTWVSSYGSDFNYDYHVSFTPEQIASGTAYYNYRHGPVPSDEMSGTSVFYKDADGTVFYTYSTYARGNEPQLAAYALLDLTPKGRDETINGNLTDWVRHHDRYDTAPQACCHSS
ncbi:MAG TPA: thioredoxin family protein [Rhodopila sp.]|nr:thioredoxin family protein [Rhodopila sp.]